MSSNPWLRLPPITADTPLGDVRQRIIFELSEDRMGYLTTYQAGLVQVYTTGEFADRRKSFSYRNGVAIGPNRPFQVLVAAAVAWVVWLCVMDRWTPSFPRWVAYLLAFGICYGLFRLIPGLNRTVNIDRRRIEIGEDRFEWSGMIGIFAVTVALAPHTTRREIIVIIDHEGNFYAHEFTALSVRFETLCAVIEYFRQPMPSRARSESR